MDIDRFDEISKGKEQLYFNKTISSHIPSPIESDYVRGYIERYFMQKANDLESKIIELDYIGYRKFYDNPFYTVIALDWKIKGTDEQIKESNSKSIKLNFSKIPKLAFYLPNLLQFKEKKDLELP
jgi:hypothetical protein